MIYNRKKFLTLFAQTLGLIACHTTVLGQISVLKLRESAFSKGLKYIGRALELEGYYVWCSSPIYANDGQVHIFFSRWKQELGMGGWLKGSEIVHATASAPDQPFVVKETVLAPRGAGYWDATTCHNPSISQFNNTYYLYYMGNSNGKTNTKRIGLATAESLDGPWKRTDQPILEAGEEGSWDDHCTTNPTVIQTAEKAYYLFYKSWNTADYLAGKGAVRGNRKYGLAVASSPEGPFKKYAHNPVIDFSAKGGNAQFEDAFVWIEKGVFYMIARDMGVQSHEDGLLMRSADGKKWSEPALAFKAVTAYTKEGPYPAFLKRVGRLERPMLLLNKENQPEWLFGASQGGKYNTSSAMVFRCSSNQIW
ncbi:Beta-xylosidase [Sphingobacterium spiritivorum]|uniref:Beta-xylosidase n=1 Tax=Sphingobacterium spiritivorum TaxID=258 RepID=A0A380B8C9_SPHSI|nr:glycoside hydrolase family protein [Sphingobacterium spiritivorum]SUI96649.1 Beta-xylosidase [Sphingobacterium spiritivorum]